MSDLEKLWQMRDRSVAMLQTAPADKQPGLRASVLGVDKVISALVENRGGVAISQARLVEQMATAAA